MIKEREHSLTLKRDKRGGYINNMEKYGVTFKEMNRKQKFEHIWDYYRYYILATIVSIIVAICLGKSLLFPPEENKVDVMVCGPIYLDGTQQEVTEDFLEKYQTGINLMSMNWENDLQTSNMMIQKIPLMVTVGSLEIIVLPVEQYKYFTKVYGTNMFTPLEEVPQLQEVLQARKDKLFVQNKGVDDKGNEIEAEEHIYGIQVEQIANIPCIEQNPELVIGLSSVLRDENKALSMYQYLLGDNTALEHFFDETSEEKENKEG